MADMGNNHQRAWQHSIKSIKDEKKRRKKGKNEEEEKKEIRARYVYYIYICGLRYNKEKLGAL
jgi:hypothetical protein